MIRMCFYEVAFYEVHDKYNYASCATITTTINESIYNNKHFSYIFILCCDRYRIQTLNCYNLYKIFNE